MIPRVILHNAVSLDGKIDGFFPDRAQFYALAAFWKEDAALGGSETILKAGKDVAEDGDEALSPIRRTLIPDLC